MKEDEDFEELAMGTGTIGDGGICPMGIHGAHGVGKHGGMYGASMVILEDPWSDPWS